MRCATTAAGAIDRLLKFGNVVVWIEADKLRLAREGDASTKMHFSTARALS